MTNERLSIGALAALSGLTTHTLRYYERAGVLRPAGRAPNGHRRYRADDVAWLEFVMRLKLTGMPLAEIRRYAQMRIDGDATLAPRLALLEAHRARLVERIAALDDSLAALDRKIRGYRRTIGRTVAAARPSIRKQGKKP